MQRNGIRSRRVGPGMWVEIRLKYLFRYSCLSYLFLSPPTKITSSRRSIEIWIGGVPQLIQATFTWGHTSPSQATNITTGEAPGCK